MDVSCPARDWADDGMHENNQTELDEACASQIPIPTSFMRSMHGLVSAWKTINNLICVPSHTIKLSLQSTVLRSHAMITDILGGNEADSSIGRQQLPPRFTIRGTDTVTQHHCRQWYIVLSIAVHVTSDSPGRFSRFRTQFLLQMNVSASSIDESQVLFAKYVHAAALAVSLFFLLLHSPVNLQ